MGAELAMERFSSVVEEECGEAQRGRISSLPILLLNVHEHCNCRCVMCDIWQRKDARELDLAEFARHRESLLKLGVRNVVLTGGEPLLHGNLETLCEFLKDCGVRITLLTTGLLLKKRAAMVARGVDEIIVSLDGPEEVHDQVRRVKGAYRLIGDGIEEVRRIDSGMPIHGRSTVQKANHRLLRQTVAAARAIRLDSISFLAADATSQAFNRELVWPGERQNQVMLSRNEVSALEVEVETLIAENAADIARHYIRESATKLRRIVGRFREHLGELEPVAPRCNAPWVSAVMEIDGGVRPCFFHRKIGNTQESSLDEAINGDEARRFRASLNVDENPTCRRCVCSLSYEPGPKSRA
jgi:Fe-coproporphyrin III synthase